MRLFPLVLMWLAVCLPVVARGQSLVIDAGGHTARVLKVLFTPDGRQLVSISEDKTIRIWSTETGKTVRVLRLPLGQGNDGMLYAAAISPDGQTLAVAGSGYSSDRSKGIYLIGLVEARVQRVLKRHLNNVISLAFSPDGKRLASGGNDLTLVLWDLSTGEAEPLINVHTKQIWDVAFSPDGKFLATASLDGTVGIWDTSGPGAKPVRRLSLPEMKIVIRVAWSPDGQILATGSENGFIRLWNPDGKLRQPPKPSFGAVTSISFNQNSRGVFATRLSGPCEFLDLRTGQSQSLPNEDTIGVLSGALSQDGARAATADFRGDIRLWNLAEPGKPSLRLFCKGDQVEGAWTEEGDILVRKDGDQQSRTFRLADLRWQEKASQATAWRPPDSRQVSLELNEGPPRTWILKSNGQTVATCQQEQMGAVGNPMLAGHDWYAVPAEFGLFLFNLRPSTAWSPQPSIPLQLYGHTGAVRSVSVSKTGRFLLSSGYDRTLRVWDLERISEMQTPGTLKRYEPILSLFFNGEDYIAWTPEAYYAASPGGQQLVGWQVDHARDALAEYHGPEQSDRLPAHLRRPDLIRSLLPEGWLRLREQDALAWIHNDLEHAPADLRPFLRYLTFAHMPDSELARRWETRRGALAKLLNSLSWKSKLEPPLAIDPRHTVYRIDLRNYSWNARLWDRILERYPYGVISPEDSLYRDIAAATKCELPYVHGDWFAFEASRPPLYHDLLGLPETELGLERLLGINTARNIEERRVIRSGFFASQVSRNNRILERHQTRYGAYWKSYDFAGNIGRQNLFGYPLGPGGGRLAFAHDGGEVIFNLPNGLQAYLLTNGQGKSLLNQPAPLNIVVDTNSVHDTHGGPAVINGISCIRCHDQGMMPRGFTKLDEVREHVFHNQNAFSDGERETIQALYRPEGEFAAFLQEDAARFKKALAGLGLPPSEDPVSIVVTWYNSPLSVERASAELGLTPEKLLDTLNHDAFLVSTLGRLRVKGSTVPRENFESIFPRAVRVWGLGTYFKREPGEDRSASLATPASEPPTQVGAENRRAGPAEWLSSWWMGAVGLVAIGALVLCGLVGRVRQVRATWIILAVLLVVGVGIGIWKLGREQPIPLASSEQVPEPQETHAAKPDRGKAEAHCVIAAAAMKERDFDRAAEEAATAIRFDAENATAHVLHGTALVEMSNFHEAIKDLTRAITLDKGSAGALRERARAHRALGQFGEAFADVNRALELHPNDPRALAERARLWAVQEYKRVETAQLEASPATMPPVPVEWQKIAIYDPALPTASAPMPLPPVEQPRIVSPATMQPPPVERPRVASPATSDLWQPPRAEEAFQAEADCRRALQLAPKLAEAYDSLGWVFLVQGRTNDALEAFRQAIRLEPERLSSAFDWAAGLKDQNALQFASSEEVRVLSFNPRYANDYCLRASVYLAKSFDPRANDLAIANYTSAACLQPEWAEPYARRALVYARKGDHDAAIADYTRALRLDPANAIGYLVGRSKAYAAKGMQERARMDDAEIERLRSVPATRYWVLRTLGLSAAPWGQGQLLAASALQAGRSSSQFQSPAYAAAIHNTVELLGIPARDAVDYYNWGIYYSDASLSPVRNNSALARAVAKFSRAIELKSDFAEAYAARGMLYLARGPAGIPEFPDWKNRGIADLKKASHLKMDQSSHVNLLLGRMVQEEGKHDQAIDYFTRALRADGVDPVLGTALFGLGDYQSGMVWREASPESATCALVGLGAHPSGMGGLLAVSSLGMKIADGSYIHAYLLRSESYLAAGKAQEALRDLDVVLFLGSAFIVNYRTVLIEGEGSFRHGPVWEYRSSEMANFFYRRGMANVKAGLLDSAIQDLSDAIQLKPDEAKAYTARAEAYEKKGLLAPAKADREKARHLMLPRPPSKI